MKEILYINTVDDIRIIDMLRVQKEHDYSKDYLTFEALEDGTFTLTIPANVDSTYMTSVSYSTDNGATWNTTTIDNTAQTITTPTINTDGKVLWKGVGKQMVGLISDTYSQFSSTGNFNVSGNMMSLLYEDNFKTQTAFAQNSSSNFCCAFYQATKLVNAKNLILPVIKARPFCYSQMFYGCTSLITAPKLPATQVENNCYSGMFTGCTSLTTPPELPATQGVTMRCYAWMFQNCTALTTAPKLPATRTTDRCYQGMFYGCTALTTPPELPSTDLGSQCYYEMFQGCTGLTTAPVLPATTLADQCYSGMFSNTNVLPDCTNIDFTSSTVVESGGLKGLFSGTKVTYNDLLTLLPLDANNKPTLPATTLASNCYNSMFYHCTSLTTAPKLPATTLAGSCYSNMFNGCTALTTVPVLPATTLANSCYQNMFLNCTSLTTAPELPATTLVSNCYYQMFSNCSNLNYIKAMFTTTPSYSYTGSWLYNVASTGTFVKNSAAIWQVKVGVDTIPPGWTIETADN